MKKIFRLFEDKFFVKHFLMAQPQTFKKAFCVKAHCIDFTFPALLRTFNEKEASLVRTGNWQIILRRKVFSPWLKNELNIFECFSV